MAADWKNGYVNNFSVFFGKETNVPHVNRLGYDVAMKMASPILTGIPFSIFFSLAQSIWKIC